MAIVPPTEAEIAAALERRRTPNREDVRDLLHRYFVAPIDDAMVDRLTAEVYALLADPEQASSTSAGFRANGNRYFGEAWKELLSPHSNRATPMELVVWLAKTSKGYPPPRPYCPEQLAGAWRQLKPVAATWQLGLDGSMQTTDPPFADRTQWCVHRVHRIVPTDEPEFLEASLWFTSSKETGRREMWVAELTPTTLHARHGSVEYRLERA